MFCFKEAIFLFFSLIYCISASTVTFDGRSFIIDNQRKLFVSGSIHYPRAPRNEWSTILQQAKDSGINIIQTYVFWDVHEPLNNQWNFPSSPTSSEDLVAFVAEAAKLDLYVHLRISGYICAEWNFGELQFVTVDTKVSHYFLKQVDYLVG
jgi:beta-galactosidase GanA